MTTGGVDSNGHLVEIMVEYEYDIVRQACVSQASGTSEIDKQDGDTPLFTKFFASHGERSS